MNGSQALITTLVDRGVDVCFANPGTSEMHFVAALDTVPAMRGVLALFEGVATGAADGYARMADKPAAVLLHLGPGLGNGLANLHNARRAGVPMLVVVGDHATYHKKYDAPLESDIDSVASTVSGWVRRTTDVAQVASDTVEALVSAERYRNISTLILPADISWGDGAQLAGAHSVEEGASAPETGDLDAVAAVLRSAVARLAYLAEAATAQLAGVRNIVLAGARSPVSFFAYPGKPSDLVPDGCQVSSLAGPIGAADALVALADRLAPNAIAATAELSRPEIPSGPLNVLNAAGVIGALLPEHAIVVDESNTSGIMLPQATSGAPAHDWLTLTGGSIGYGLPVSVGAAIACPDRPVLCLGSDGSAMYTISALWTQAREQLNVTTIVYANRSYDILRIELHRVGALEDGGGPGPKTNSLLDLGNPSIDFVRIAEGMGVPSRRVDTAEALADAMRWAFEESGPHLIEAVVPSLAG